MSYCSNFNQGYDQYPVSSSTHQNNSYNSPNVSNWDNNYNDDGDCNDYFHDDCIEEGDENDFDNEDSDLSNPESDSEDLNIPEEEPIDISADPELTNDIKKKLMYSDSPFSDDHMFWVNTKHFVVKSAKKKMHDLQHSIKNAENKKRANLIQRLEQLEKSFIKSHVKKVQFTENAPFLRRTSYNQSLRNKNRLHKLRACPAQIKMKKAIHTFKNDLKILKRLKNKHFLKLQNELYLKIEDYKKQFWIPKTTDDFIYAEKRRQAIEEKRQTAPVWRNELSDSIKNKLLHQEPHFSTDDLFWVNSKARVVRIAKSKLRDLKKNYDNAVKGGKLEAIEKTKNALQKEEDLFINTHIKKIEFDETLPEIAPLSESVRRAIYKRQYSVFDVKKCVEQLEMCIKLKDLKRNYLYLNRNNSIYAKQLLNDLYHKEWNYYKLFLNLKKSVVLGEIGHEKEPVTEEQLKQKIQIMDTFEGRRRKPKHKGNGKSPNTFKQNPKNKKQNKSNPRVHNSTSDFVLPLQSGPVQASNVEEQESEWTGPNIDNMKKENFMCETEFPHEIQRNYKTPFSAKGTFNQDTTPNVLWQTQNQYEENPHNHRPMNNQTSWSSNSIDMPRELQQSHWKSDRGMNASKEEPDWRRTTNNEQYFGQSDEQDWSNQITNQGPLHSQRDWTKMATRESEQNNDMRETNYSKRNHTNSLGQYENRESSSWRRRDVRHDHHPDRRQSRDNYNSYHQDIDYSRSNKNRSKSPLDRSRNQHERQRDQGFHREQNRSERNWNRSNSYHQNDGYTWSDRNQRKNQYRQGQRECREHSPYSQRMKNRDDRPKGYNHRDDNRIYSYSQRGPRLY